MNVPYGFHLIQTQCELYQTLSFTLPLPFEDGKTVNACVEMRPMANERIHIDLWGELPQYEADFPETRTLFASADIPGPKISPFMDHNSFMKALVASISHSAEFQSGIKDLLDMHLEALSEEGGEDNAQ